MLEAWLSSVEATPGTLLCVLSYADGAAASDLRQQCLDWTLDNGFELIEAHCGDTVTGAGDREKVGVHRVLEALQATMWSNMAMKTGKAPARGIAPAVVSPPPLTAATSAGASAGASVGAGAGAGAGAAAVTGAGVDGAAGAGVDKVALSSASSLSTAVPTVVSPPGSEHAAVSECDASASDATAEEKALASLLYSNGCTGSYTAPVAAAVPPATTATTSTAAASKSGDERALDELETMLEKVSCHRLSRPAFRAPWIGCGSGCRRECDVGNPAIVARAVGLFR